MNNNIIDFCKLINFKKNKSNDSNDNIKFTCPYSEKLELKISYLEKQINDTKWILGILITIFGLIVPILCNMHSRVIDKMFEAYNKEILSKFEIIQQQLNAQKEINQLQIQKDVAIEIKRQSK